MMARMDDPKLLYHGRKFDIRLVEVDAGTAAERIEPLVVHPGAVVLVPVTDGGDLVLIRNHRYAVGAELWELPAGTIEPPEEPLACAHRELREETGFEARTLEPLTRYYSTPGMSTERMHVFIARGLRQVGQRLDVGERIRVETVPPDRVLAMMVSGEIEDSKTLAALGLYLLTNGREP